MRGEFHDYGASKLMPTFNPAYLLRDPSKKREVWEDMKRCALFSLQIKEGERVARCKILR
jgi:DNA polymerase